MLVKILLTVLLLAGPPTQAAICKYSKRNALEVSGENFTATLSDHNRITVIAVHQIPFELREQAVALLNEALSLKPSLLLRMRFFLDQNKEVVTDSSTNVLYLQETLFESNADYVAIDLPGENIANLEKIASNFDPSQMAAAPNVDLPVDDINHLTLMSVGPAVYLKARDPKLFQNVRLEMLPTKDALVPQGTSLKLSQALEALKDSKRSRQKLEKADGDLKAGKYAGLSHEEIKKKILVHFWKPAKQTVSNWLDSELGQHQKALPPILSKNGRGVAFVSEETFNTLEKLVLGYCSQ